MAATTINGVSLAGDVKMAIKRSVFKLQEHEIEPCLATILVGSDPASATYVRKKHEACTEVGIAAMDHRLREDTTQEDLNETIRKLNADDMIHGILLQLPLPRHLDPLESTSMISPDKDVDGLTAHNIGLLAMGVPKLVPCTPLAIMSILEYCKIDLVGKIVTIINRSNLVGKPMQQLLLQKDATVITCHSKTKDIAKFCRIADVVITAVGNRRVFELRPDMLKDGCVVIDVAITRHNGKMVGDADYDKIVSKVSHITPVPGGVGPMTVAMLLKNTVTAAASINNIRL